MPKRVLSGVVVSDKTDKTIIVKVERRFTHPVLKKTVRRSKKYHAHDETNVAKTGQIVQIQESRPYSKTKTWKLVEGTAAGGSGIVDTVSEAIGGAIDKVKETVGLS